jgi:hypothetical protein
MVAPNRSRDGIDQAERGFSMPEQLMVDEPMAMSSNFYGVKTSLKTSHHKTKSPGNMGDKTTLRSYDTIMKTVNGPLPVNEELRKMQLKGSVKYFYGNDSLKAEREKQLAQSASRSGSKPYTRRVILVHGNGSESVVDFILAPDGGDDPVYHVPDKREMMLQLRREGYRDVEDIRM